MIFVFSSGFLNYSQPKVKFERIEVKKISFDKADVEFIYIIDNPNPIGIDNVLFDYHLFLDGNDFAKGENVHLKIKAKEKNTFPFPMEIKYIDLFKSTEALTKRILSGSKSIPFKMDTVFKFNLMGYPLDSGNYYM